MSTKRDARSDAAIDIKQELADLFRKEDMVAYFDVTSSPDVTPQLSGICKIAEPTPGAKGGQYLSLLFIIDAPDADALRMAKECVRRIDEDRLIKCAPEITSVVLMPESTIGDAYYVRHIDLLLEPTSPVEVRTLVGRIHEAVRQAPCLEPGDLVWWKGAGDDANESGATPEGSVVNASIMNKIKKRLGIDQG